MDKCEIFNYGTVSMHHSESEKPSPSSFEKHCHTTYEVLLYVEMGLGVAFIPSYSWRGLFSDNIVLKSVGISRKTYAYVPANRYTKRAVREFIKVLLDEAKSAPPISH